MKKQRPILFLMCGLPGSGKTTLAKQIELRENALRLTPDEWMSRIVGDGFNEEKRAEVEAMLWDIAARCLQLGINVILDFGFWSRAERDDFRKRARKLDANTEIHYLEVTLEELLKRVKQRKVKGTKHSFMVTEKQLREWVNCFEAPSKDELSR